MTTWEKATEVGDIVWSVQGKQVQGKGFPNGPSTLREMFSVCFESHKNKDFILYDSEKWTFGQIYERAMKLAFQLETTFKIAVGDNVAICTRNYPEWCITFIATTYIGGIANLLDFNFSRNEVVSTLTSRKCKLLICDGKVFNACQGGLMQLRKTGLETVLIRHSLDKKMYSRLPNVGDLNDSIDSAAGMGSLRMNVKSELSCAVVFNKSASTVYQHRALVSCAKGFLKRNLTDTGNISPGCKMFSQFDLSTAEGCFQTFLGAAYCGYALYISVFPSAENIAKEIEDRSLTNISCTPEYAERLLKCMASDSSASSLKTISLKTSAIPREEQIEQLIAMAKEKNMELNIEAEIIIDCIAGCVAVLDMTSLLENNGIIEAPDSCVQFAVYDEENAVIKEKPGYLFIKSPMAAQMSNFKPMEGNEGWQKTSCNAVEENEVFNLRIQ